MQSSEHEPSDRNPFYVTQWPRLTAHPDECERGDRLSRSWDLGAVPENEKKRVIKQWCAREKRLAAGMCVGFRAGTGDAHQLVNRSEADVRYLEVGDRGAGDSAIYPDDALLAVSGDDGKWQFKHKDGTPY